MLIYSSSYINFDVFIRIFCFNFSQSRGGVLQIKQKQEMEKLIETHWTHICIPLSRQLPDLQMKHTECDPKSIYISPQKSF